MNHIKQTLFAYSLKLKLGNKKYVTRLYSLLQTVNSSYPWKLCWTQPSHLSWHQSAMNHHQETSCHPRSCSGSAAGHSPKGLHLERIKQNKWTPPCWTRVKATEQQFVTLYTTVLLHGTVSVLPEKCTSYIHEVLSYCLLIKAWMGKKS